MANEFSKEERVAFEDIIEGFEDALVVSKNVTVYRGLSDSESERASDVIWRPQPYIMQTYDGTDQTSNFQSATQLSVPSTLGYEKAAPWTMTATELRDALQENRLGEAAKQRLASDINVAVSNVAALQGTLVVKRTTASAGFDDLAEADALMTEQGVMQFDRYFMYSPRDYNGAASNLAGRATMTGKVVTAYEKAYVGQLSNFETFKMNYAYNLAAAAGGASLTIDTTTATAQNYVPVSTRTATTGEKSNVDNRYQTVTISSTTSVAAGDCFTIAGIYACHHITKQSTGQLKTFRVISVDSSTTMTISPPLITNQGGTDAEAQYQNCIASSESATAAIVFLNTVLKPANCFWYKDAIELRPGRYAVPNNAGAAVMRATTEQGIELVMQKQYDIKTMNTFYRIDTSFGVTMVQPQMAGIMLFSQT